MAEIACGEPLDSEMEFERNGVNLETGLIGITLHEKWVCVTGEDERCEDDLSL